jgi:hypothetical protein
MGAKVLVIGLYVYIQAHLVIFARLADVRWCTNLVRIVLIGLMILFAGIIYRLSLPDETHD